MLLLSVNTDSYLSATLDGKVWHQPHIIYTILTMKNDLPHLKELISAFFEGALTTWHRFTAEFTPGGLIDMSSIDEKDGAWMPSTNDVNEGALGSFQVYLRSKPSTTMASYNVQAMFHRNGTQSFMSLHLTEVDDDKYIKRIARQEDSSGKERKRKDELLQHEKEIVEVKRRKDEVSKKKKTDKEDRLSRIQLELDMTTLRNQKFTNAMLVDQLDLHHQFNTDIPPKSQLKNKEMLLEALVSAIEYYSSRSIHTNLIQGDDNNLEDVDMIIADDPNDYDTDSSMED